MSAHVLLNLFKELRKSNEIKQVLASVIKFISNDHDFRILFIL